jgi:hypothetical protein
MISTFVRADRLRLATLFQSHEETRYYLNGVFIERCDNSGVNLVSMDGHRLGVFHDDAGFTETRCIVSVPKAALDAIKKCKEKEFCWFAIIGEHNGTGRHEARVYNTTGQAGELSEAREKMHDICDPGVIWAGAVHLIDGEYPAYRDVVPAMAKEAAPGSSFNPKYLKNFGEVCGGSMRVYTDGVGPALVLGERADFVGVLMPMNAGNGPLIGEGPVKALPSWLGEAAVARVRG